MTGPSGISKKYGSNLHVKSFTSMLILCSDQVYVKFIAWGSKSRAWEY